MLSQIDITETKVGDIVLYAAIIPREARDEAEAEDSFDYSVLSLSTGSRRSTQSNRLRIGRTAKLRPCVVVFIELNTRQIGLRAISSFGKKDLATAESLVLQQRALALQAPSHLSYLPVLKLQGVWPNNVKGWVLLNDSIVAHLPRNVTSQEALRIPHDENLRFPSLDKQSVYLICELTRFWMLQLEQGKGSTLSEVEYRRVLQNIASQFPGFDLIDEVHPDREDEHDDTNDKKNPLQNKTAIDQTASLTMSSAPRTKETSDKTDRDSGHHDAQESIDVSYEVDDQFLSCTIGMLFHMPQDFNLPTLAESRTIACCLHQT